MEFFFCETGFLIMVSFVGVSELLTWLVLMRFDHGQGGHGLLSLEGLRYTYFKLLG